MIYGYAIEPELVSTWGSQDNFRFFYEKFGIGEPRLLVEYPGFKNWRRQVLKAAAKHEGTLEHERILEMISRLGETKIQKNFCNYDGTLSWLENTERDCESDAILATVNPRSHVKILLGALVGVKSHELWSFDKEIIIKRNPQDMSRALAALLRNSATVIFIDPYFRANESRWREPLKAFLIALSSNKKDLSLLNVEFHVSADYAKAPSWDYFRRECEKDFNLSSYIPVGMKVIFKLWAQKPNGQNLHNRYVLTDIGGVKFSNGLSSGDEGETDEITLMSRESYNFRWQQYVSSEPAFESAGESFEIIGTGQR